MHNGLFFVRSLKNKDSVMNLWQSLKNTWNNFAFDNPEFSERIDEIRKRRKQREEELEEIEKQGAFNYYLKDVGGYIREAMNQYERENKQ